MQPRSYEETQIAPGERRISAGHADVIATLGDPLLQDSVDKALEIGAYFGDTEAFLSQTAADIVANLEVVARTLRFHPEQSIATVLARMSYQDKLDTITHIRAMLDKIEAHAMPDIPTTAVPIMLTGTRTIANPDEVRKSLVRVIDKLTVDTDSQQCVGICGGAEGADQLFAEACIETGTFFVMVVPNWAYPFFYDREEDFAALKASQFCLGFDYTVERPEVPDWKDRWKAEKWWRDNFARNRDMIDRAREMGGHHIICGPNHPKVLFEDTSIGGGTAHCVRLMRERDVHKAVYVNTLDPENIVWVEF